MKLKKLVLVLLVITLLIPVTYSDNITKATAGFNISGYRCSDASLIEWTKINGATKYKVYRATRKKNKKYTKFKKIGTVSESWFTKYGDNILSTRWFVNVCYDGRKKCPQKGHRYNHKKTYKYKVVALNRKSTVSVSKIATIKKYKNKKYQPGYDVLYYANKERYKAKQRVLPWGHVLEKGAKKRILDCVYRHKNGESFKKKDSSGAYIYHKRPTGRLTKEEKQYNPGRKNIWMYVRQIDKSTLQPCNLENHRENLSKNCIYGFDVINGYMHSPGHKKTLLQNEDTFGMYCSYKCESPTFEVTILHSPRIIISTNYDNLVTERERISNDKNAKVPIKYKNIINNAYKNTQKDVDAGYPLSGYFGFTFYKSDITKCKNLYPYCTDSFLANYFNETTYNYFNIKTSYYYDDNGKQCKQTYVDIKPEYEKKINQMYVSFIKEYAKIIPYF